MRNSFINGNKWTFLSLDFPKICHSLNLIEQTKRRKYFLHTIELFERIIFVRIKRNFFLKEFSPDKMELNTFSM